MGILLSHAHVDANHNCLVSHEKDTADVDGAKVKRLNMTGGGAKTWMLVCLALLVLICGSAFRAHVTTTRGQQVATPPSSDLPAAVLLARERAADDAGIPVDQVEIITYREERWPTSALGCSRPGTRSMQVLTPGYRVRMLLNGGIVTYHTDRATTLVRC